MPKEILFQNSQMQICNIEEKQQDTSLQVRWLAEEISILELLILLLLERKELCLYRKQSSCSLDRKQTHL